MKTLFLLLLGVYVQGRASNLNPDSPSDWNNRGSQLFSTNHYREAEDCFQRALSLSRTAPVSDPDEVTTILINLAAVYRTQARYVEAERTYLAALNQATTGSGPRVPGSLRGLALVYLATGQFTKAEDYARRNLAVRIQQQADAASIAEARNDLASVLLEQSRFAEAEHEAAQALAAFPEQDWSSQRESANALNLLGRISLAQGRNQSADAYLSRAAPLLERLLGPESPSAAAVYANLAEARALCGDWHSGVDLFSRAITALEKAYGKNHPDVAIALSNLGSLYKNRKSYKKAEALYNRALEIDRSVFGPESLRTAVDLNNLGSIAFLQHRLDESETLLQHALAINQRSLGDRNTSTGLLAGNLAHLYCQRKQYGEAEPLLEMAISVRKVNYGPDDPMLGILLSEYTFVLRRTGHFAEAEKAEVQATRIQFKHLSHRAATGSSFKE